MRRRLSDLTILGVILALGGCVQVTTIERTIEQTGLVPAPGGPHSTGPMLLENQVRIEGTYSGQFADGTDKSRYQDITGNVVLNHTARLRFAYAPIDQIELSVDIEYSNAEWGVSVANDAKPDLVDQSHLVRGGFGFRALLAGTREKGFGTLLEFSFASLPYHRVVYERAYLSTYYVNNPFWWLDDELKTQYLGSSLTQRSDNVTYFYFRHGLFGTFAAGRFFYFTIGMMLQNQPEFFGTLSTVETCTPSLCGDESDIDETSDRWLGTLFGSVTVLIGQLTITGQLYAHALGDYDYIDAHPFGGEITAGVTF